VMRSRGDDVVLWCYGDVVATWWCGSVVVW